MLSKAGFLGRAALGLVAIAILSGIVMLLWNAIIPELFAGARSIDYLRALGLLVLSRILFGGFRGYAGWHWHRHGWRGGPWSNMTPEERERIRHGHPWGRHAGRGE